MSIKRVQKLKNKARRELFVAGQIKTGIPFQVRAMRDKKGWTQAQLGTDLGMTQTNVSRLESPGYGRLNITTLQRIASVFDVALVVRFVPFSELIRWTDNLSPEAMAPASFGEEIDSLEKEAASLTTYTVPVRAFAESEMVSYALDHIAPKYWAVAPHGFTPSDAIDARWLNAGFMPSEENIAELLAEASAWLSDEIVTKAPEVTDEKDTPTSVSDFFIPVGSDTSIIDYSALKPLA